MNPLIFSLTFEMEGINEVLHRPIKIQEQDVTNYPGGKFMQDKVRTAIRNALKKEFPLGSKYMKNIHAKIGNYKVYIGGINE